MKREQVGAQNQIATDSRVTFKDFMQNAGGAGHLLGGGIGGRVSATYATASQVA